MPTEHKRLPENLSSPANSPSGGDTVGAVASPDLNSKPEARSRSIRDVVQAKNLITTFEHENLDRNLKNARIMSRYNAERPYSCATLKAEGLDWKTNFSTQPLPLLVDKIAPRFVEAVEGVKYLTNSKLPDTVPGAAAKTEAFRREVTTVVRARAGWRDLIADFSQENAMFGYAAVAWLDEFVWFPKFFRQDAFYIPTGTSQRPKNAQVVVLKEPLLIHEAFSLIEDRKAATTRGWNVPEMIKQINSAMPDNRRSGQMDVARIYEDLFRESVMGTSFENGARKVTLWHILATEIDGKVSHYILAGTDCKEVFTSEDQFESMPDAISFFSFQQGNGTMHGSKGIGRQVYQMAGILDRSRNEVVDRLNLAGKLLIQGDEKQLRKFKMSLIGNAILIGSGYQVLEQKYDAAVEPFLELDNFLTRLLDQISGATTPKVFEGERVTKAQVDFFAGREEQTRDTIIGRFLNQFADMMTTLQKRLCDPQTSEKDAKEMQKRLLEIMTREELTQLSKQVVAETVKDYTDLERQQVVLVATEASGNPLFNQRELQRRKVTAQVDEEFADAVMLPEEDPTVVAEQTRLQMFELQIIATQASQVPVSPRDNDLVHLQVLLQAMEATAKAAANDPGADQVLEAMLVHAEAHIASADAKGLKSPEYDETKKMIAKLRSDIAKLHALGAQQTELAAAGVPATVTEQGEVLPAPGGTEVPVEPPIQ